MAQKCSLSSSWSRNRSRASSTTASGESSLRGEGCPASRTTVQVAIFRRYRFVPIFGLRSWSEGPRRWIAPRPSVDSEWHLVRVPQFLRHGLPAGVHGLTLCRTAERDEPLRVNLRAWFPIRRLARADRAVDVDQGPLAVLRRDVFRPGAPHQDAVPLGVALSLSVLRPHLICGDPEPCQRSAGLRVDQFRISPEVADQNHLVNHRLVLLYRAGAGCLHAARPPSACCLGTLRDRRQRSRRQPPGPPPSWT